jgi:hypothetical protein
MKTLSRNNTPSRQETSRANLRTSAGESTKLAAEGRMIDRTARATAAYAQAKDFSDRHFPAEVIWQRTVSMDGVTESAFLREAAWVILCTGFRERTLRTRFGYLSLCFCDWESGAVIAENAEACRATALAAFNHPRKVDAIIQIARRVAREGFTILKRRILCQPIEVLKTLPYIGPITAYHLAKNLGLPVAKPDRHLPRWPPENRPNVATSKPANEAKPEQEYL